MTDEEVTEWQSRAELALAAARVGGVVARAYFRKPDVEIEWKKDDSPVTIADTSAEEAIRAHIEAAFPEDGWIGEESGVHAGKSPYRWIVDPIDGTRNFIQGIPLWSTLVACEELLEGGATRIIASAVGIPALDEWYDAWLTGGARCNGAPITVGDTDSLKESMWCFETRSWFVGQKLAPVFDHLMNETRLQRGLCDAYAHMLVATGRADVVIEPSLSVWDVAAPSLIVQEAGGRYTTITGAEDLRAGNCLVSNGHVHDETVRLIDRLRLS